MAESRTSSPDEAATEEREELLATKLNIPQPRPDQLHRSRLIDRLNQGMAQKLIMVCTPAGFGKTSLLADWAASTDWPVAWLSLDSQDNDPVRFWRVVGALDRTCGGLAEQVLPLLTPTSVIGGEVVVTALANQLQAGPEALALVLDDYHLIESRPIHEGMTYLLDHLPPRLRLVISSRSPPAASGTAAGQGPARRAAGHRPPVQSRRNGGTAAGRLGARPHAAGNGCARGAYGGLGGGPSAGRTVLTRAYGSRHVCDGVGRNPASYKIRCTPEFFIAVHSLGSLSCRRLLVSTALYLRFLASR
jgi:hypothetical protein